MNFWFREFLFPFGSGNFSSLRVREFLFPSGHGISHSGNFSSHRVREFLIQGISDSGNFWFREFLIQGISDSGNFWFREFPPPGPPGEAGNLSYPPWISHSGNFSFQLNFSFGEFLLPSMNFWFRGFLIQGISDSGNFSSLRGLQGRREFILPSMNFSFREFIILYEFLIQGISPTLYEFLIQGIYPPSGASRGGGNFSYPLWIYHSRNFQKDKFLQW